MITITTSHADGVYYYKLFYFAAILTGIVFTALAAHKKQYSFREFVFIISTGIFSLIVGSKLALLNAVQWEALLFQHQLPVETGKTVLGAILGGMIGAYVAGTFCGRKESVLDITAVSFPLGMAIQRFGCLFAGCCHGVVTFLPWGITYVPGSKLFETQQQLHLIPANAAHSLPVHPDQLYHIVACLLIALIAFKTSARWRSPSGKFIFSVLLYLAFRFAEEFTRDSLYPEMIIGLKVVQWKVLFSLVILSALLFYRERKYRLNPATLANSKASVHADTRPLLLSVTILFIALWYGSWFTADERMIMLFTVIPSCAFITIEFLVRYLMLPKYFKGVSLAGIALLIMSQKIDTTAVAPESYTAIDANYTTGKFDIEHDYGLKTITVIDHGTDCDGNPTSSGPYTRTVSKQVPYEHTYNTGGISLLHKEYFSPFRSITVAGHFYWGIENQQPITSAPADSNPPSFRKVIWGLSPMVNYDGRGIGVGLGVNAGVLGYENKEPRDDAKNYNPDEVVRKTAVLMRLRLFSERNLFLENITEFDPLVFNISTNNNNGYDNTAERKSKAYKSKFMLGSRFNTDKYMLKIGFINSSMYTSSFLVEGQVYIAPGCYLYPQLMLGGSKSNYNQRYSAGLTFEYRYYNNKVRAPRR